MWAIGAFLLACYWSFCHQHCSPATYGFGSYEPLGFCASALAHFLCLPRACAPRNNIQHLFSEEEPLDTQCCLFVLVKSPSTEFIDLTIHKVILTISLFFVCFILLPVRGNPKQSHDFVWNTFLNYTGWPDGVCFLIGLTTSCYMFNGLDGAMHMAEESSNPERVVPRTMLGAVGIGFTTGFAYAVAQVYAISDIEEVMTTMQ